MTDELVLQPNVEALVVQFLRDQEEVTALVGNRIYTEIPASPDWPLVRVRVYYERPVNGSRPLWLTAHDVQVEAYGGPKSVAWRVAETCRAALTARFEGAYSYGAESSAVSGTVTHVAVSGLRDLPDEFYSPARPRWMFTATAYVHPGA